MMAALQRPTLPAFPGAGLMRAEHFQVAYATTDLERAVALLDERFGIGRFARLGGPLPEGGEIEAAFAWAGGTMIELLSARGPGSVPYMDRLPQTGFATGFHHLGYLVPDEAGWHSIRAEVTRAGRTVRVDADVPGFMRFLIVDAPELGHHLEYILPEPAGLAFLQDAPGA